MNLKLLALIACIAQALSIVLGLCQSILTHTYSAFALGPLALNVPLVLFFFYVWKKQKP